jgi:hypothetical protein
VAFRGRNQIYLTRVSAGGKSPAEAHQTDTDRNDPLQHPPPARWVLEARSSDASR